MIDQRIRMCIDFKSLLIIYLCLVTKALLKSQKKIYRQGSSNVSTDDQKIQQRLFVKFIMNCINLHSSTRTM